MCIRDRSLKNFFTVRNVMERYRTQEVRFYILNTHYRGPLNYGEEALNEAATSLKRLQHTYTELEEYLESASGRYDADDLVKRVKTAFLEFMDDDFNTRGAISELFDLARESNKLMDHELLSKKGTQSIISLFEDFDQILGILPTVEKTEDYLDDVMQIVLQIRQELRKRKMYDLADKLRNDLAAKGITIEDSAEGPRWNMD